MATKKDFEPANRKRFCSRIATGDYDAVIIGHSQFEKIPLSRERQIALLKDQIADITFSIESAKTQVGEQYTVKQMEKTKKTLKAKLEKLNDQTRKDDVVTFEQLGVDRLFVDESHYYKNLFLYTKMRNVAGISQTDAQKSSDIQKRYFTFMKCRYMDEITTPVRSISGLSGGKLLLKKDCRYACGCRCYVCNDSWWKAGTQLIFQQHPASKQVLHDEQKEYNFRTSNTYTLTIKGKHVLIMMEENVKDTLK